MPTPSASMITLRPSRLLVCLCFALVTVSCGASWQSQLSLPWLLVATLSATGYGVYLMTRYALLKHPLSITALSFQRQNQSWMVCLNRQRWLSVKLLPETLVTRFFIVLQVRCEGKRHVALLVQDNLMHGLFSTLQRQLLFCV